MIGSGVSFEKTREFLLKLGLPEKEINKDIEAWQKFTPLEKRFVFEFFRYMRDSIQQLGEERLPLITTMIRFELLVVERFAAMDTKERQDLAPFVKKLFSTNGGFDPI